jgi:hypothetical protein
VSQFPYLPPATPILAVLLPLVLLIQLDNACLDNKKQYVFSFFSLLVYKGVFHEVYINFLIVGHTHEDIDTMYLIVDDGQDISGLQLCRRWFA